MTDIDELERLARAATPGPYFPETYSSGQRQVCGDLRPIDEDEGTYSVVADVFTRENQEYQVATNPATILALIAEVRALRADKARLDFYEANLNSDVDRDGVYSVWLGRGWGDEFTGNTFREAIDAARKEKA